MERLLPNNPDAERGVLGSLILDPEAMIQIADWLRPDDFYHDAHRTIYEAIAKLYEGHQPADFITLCDLLTTNEQLEACGGPSYLTSLISYVPTSGNLLYYARIVNKKAAFRRLIHAAGRIAALAYEEIENAQEQAEQLLFSLQRGAANDFVSLSETLSACEVDLEARQKNEPYLQCVPTGFCTLDSALGSGLQRSDLIILAARPGQGKTSLGLNIARHASQSGMRVAFFSLEMASKQLGMRLLAQETGHDQRLLRQGMIDDWSKVVTAVDKLSTGKFWINETPGISHSDLRSKARRLQSTHGIDLIVVDYLQLMSAAPSEGKRYQIREQEIAEISRNLKALAKELNVPVLALAQLNRAVEIRQSKRPILSDLRESGSLENDADVVLFISREDPCQIGANTEMQSYADIFIAKHRNGPIGELRLRFNPSLTSFHDV